MTRTYLRAVFNQSIIELEYRASNCMLYKYTSFCWSSSPAPLTQTPTERWHANTLSRGLAPSTMLHPLHTHGAAILTDRLVQDLFSAS